MIPASAPGGMKEKRDRLELDFDSHGIDGFLVTNITNVRYISGFTGTSGCVLLAAKDKGFFLTDGRYKLQARSEVKDLGIKVYRRALDGIAELVRGFGLKRLGFEARALDYDAYRRLKKVLPGVALKPLVNLVEEKRAVKSPSELKGIRKAIEVAEKGFRSVERGRLSGRAEGEIAWLMEASCRKAGAQDMAFATIVASGKRSALPHGVASAKKIKKGEFVIVDMGVSVDGYKSDKTRTYVIGRAGAMQRKIYNIVKDANDMAIESIRDGLEARSIDAVARAFIRKAGYGRYFTHGLGHGVGLDVHESPSLNPKSTDVLKEGMVVTIEPGIYVPDFGGVRIEDMVLVKKGGCEILTGGSKELRILE